MENKKLCTRCGECCEAAPCFMIAIGKEKYDEKGKHICPFYSKLNDISNCRIYKKFSHDGFCSNTKKK